MPRKIHQAIPSIPYPPEYLEDLKRLSPIAVEGLKLHGLPIESGTIPLGKLDPELEVAYFFLNWVSESNGVIDNLNLTLHDLRALPKKFSLLEGAPWSRYELMVRVFFHEFYRLREIFNAVMSACVKRGYLEKSELSVVRNAFHGAIEQTIELRNSFVHGSPTWAGEEHFDLFLTSSFYDRGEVMVHKGTGSELSLEAVLEKACAKAASNLQVEGESISTIIGAFVRGTAAIANETRSKKKSPAT